MSEEICPVKDCSDDCEQCDGLAPFEECVYVILYRGIKSGEFQRSKSRPWKDVVREIQSSDTTAKGVQTTTAGKNGCQTAHIPPDVIIQDEKGRNIWNPKHRSSEISTRET